MTGTLKKSRTIIDDDNVMAYIGMTSMVYEYDGGRILDRYGIFHQLVDRRDAPW